MVNQYGQTDIVQALLKQGTSPNPYKTGLGQAARLGGIALAEWGKRKKADESRSALADALAGLNGGALTGEGPTTDAAGRAPIGDPQLMARLLSDPNTAQVGQALLGRALQPAPERKIIKGADGYNYWQDTQDRVLPGVEKQQDMKFGWRMGPNGLEPVPGGPNDPAYIEQTAPMKRPQTNVNVNNRNTLPFDEQIQLIREEKRAEAMGKLDSATLEDYRELSASAEDQLPILRVMRELAPTLKTGALGETALNVQKTMERFGIPLDISGDTTKAELFQKLSNSMTLLQRKPGSGEMSDSDRDFFQNTVANLFTTPEGNALAIEFAMRRANRALDMEEQYSEWLRGGQEQPWATVRNKYLRENPLFTEADRAKAEAVSVRAGAAGPSQPGNAEKAARLNSMGRAELMNIDPLEFDDPGLLRLYMDRMKATR